MPSPEKLIVAILGRIDSISDDIFSDSQPAFIKSPATFKLQAYLKESRTFVFQN